MRKKCVISVNSYYLKNHIYLSEIVIALILNVAAEVIVHFWHRNKQMDPLPLEKMNRSM